MRSVAVYSTDSGRLCPQCQKTTTSCACKTKQSQQVLGNGQVRVGFETKGRKGKGMTIIRGLPLNATELTDLAKTFKQKCGTGGSVEEGAILIQGDHRDSLLAELIKRGYAAKKTGG
jgi:translation initiation factor 1